MCETIRARYEQLRDRRGHLFLEIPGPMAGFNKLHARAADEGDLDRKVKELIALGLAIALRCDGCIAHHVHDTLEAVQWACEMLGLDPYYVANEGRFVAFVAPADAAPHRGEPHRGPAERRADAAHLLTGRAGGECLTGRRAPPGGRTGPICPSAGPVTRPSGAG